MDTFIALAAAFGRGSGIALSAPVYATVSGLHVIGIALLFGPILIADLAILRLIQGYPARAIDTLRNAAKIGTALALVTGALLFTARPQDYVANGAFLVKLVIVGLGVANALAFEVMARRLGLAAMLVARPARVAAALSIVLWLAVIGLGRWIAFV